MFFSVGIVHICCLILLWYKIISIENHYSWFCKMCGKNK